MPRKSVASFILSWKWIAFLSALIAVSCLDQSEKLEVSGPYPSDTTVAVGGSVTFKVYGYCGEPCGTFNFQWKKNGADLSDTNGSGITGISGSNTTESGSTPALLTLTNIQLADSGSYTCLVDYPEIPDTKLSSVAHLRVVKAP